MKLTKIHLIIILALALILCPILGVCSNIREGYDNIGSDRDVNVTEGLVEGVVDDGDDEGDDDVQEVNDGFAQVQ